MASSAGKAIAAPTPAQYRAAVDVFFGKEVHFDRSPYAGCNRAGFTGAPHSERKAVHDSEHELTKTDIDSSATAICGDRGHRWPVVPFQTAAQRIDQQLLGYPAHEDARDPPSESPSVRRASGTTRPSGSEPDESTGELAVLPSAKRRSRRNSPGRSRAGPSREWQDGADRTLPMLFHLLPQRPRPRLPCCPRAAARPEAVQAAGHSTSSSPGSTCRGAPATSAWNTMYREHARLRQNAAAAWCRTHVHAPELGPITPGTP